MVDDDYLLTNEAYVVVDVKYSMKDKRSVVDKNPMMDELSLTDNLLTDEHSLVNNYALVGNYPMNSPVDKHSSVDKVNKYLVAADPYTVTDYEDGNFNYAYTNYTQLDPADLDPGDCSVLDLLGVALGRMPEAEQGRGDEAADSASVQGRINTVGARDSASSRDFASVGSNRGAALTKCCDCVDELEWIPVEFADFVRGVGVDVLVKDFEGERMRRADGWRGDESKAQIE
ncbi:hypothetical protein PHYSODRAFT_326323 [Phytophthora sojae]|uniref:Uncharacterized protein n=1 Tax=Phytophthora sojae (strain P6497) TaxID=1094619 RepID=G4Z1D1_PHYSP|nr:hypothetical protein PHYSODRAFT_326323 [Phytophthora sojae]EGZ25279.1 hypothetical protein PHYSODRAFT_326323 [Phytophthora sojae]|eukprot:XP_009520567.1 hypothetical protein PHYSODRAFT_326323 [Phytophthora sojae]